MDACTTCRDPQLKIRPRGTACTNDATFENGSSLFLKANVEQRARQVALLYLTLFIKNEIADCRKQKCAHCTLYIHPTMLQQIEGCVPFQNYVDVHPHTSARLNKCPYWDVESIEASLLLLTSGMVEMLVGGSWFHVQSCRRKSRAWRIGSTHFTTARGVLFQPERT